MKEVEYMNKCENIFVRDNKLCFEEKAWKQLLKINLIILIEDKWITIERKK
jgi:hypothetical protein